VRVAERSGTATVAARAAAAAAGLTAAAHEKQTGEETEKQAAK